MIYYYFIESSSQLRLVKSYPLMNFGDNGGVIEFLFHSNIDLLFLNFLLLYLIFTLNFFLNKLKLCSASNWQI